MNKYKVFESAGNVLMALGILIALISASIDVDHSAEGAMRYVILGFIIGFAMVVVGAAFTHLHMVEGHALSIMLVVCGWLGMTFHLNGTFFRNSAKFVRKAGGYLNAYDICYMKYDSIG